MKTTRTPGPWSASYGVYGEYFITAGGCLRFDTEGGFKKHDAHLIAAAPDLLTALTSLADWNWKNKGKCPIELLEHARAAIAKAKGE